MYHTSPIKAGNARNTPYSLLAIYILAVQNIAVVYVEFIAAILTVPVHIAHIIPKFNATECLK